ncbi:MAG: thioredoxin family protein [Candidatus Marinamargulisbacteria bacterium]
MALVESSAATKGQPQPSFSLLSTHHGSVSSDDYKGPQGLLIVFTCNLCPYAMALWDRLIRDAKKIQAMGFGILAINSNNHPDYPDDGWDHMITLSERYALPFPYLWDPDQSVAHQYDAQCTPDNYIVSVDDRLLYRGAYDDDWKNASNVRRPYVMDQLTAISMGTDCEDASKWVRSMGCSIKWQ